MNKEEVKTQIAMCAKHQVQPYPCPANMKVGVSRGIKENVAPVNGMRIAPEGDVTGWFIWSGEQLSEEPDFFLPLHVAHLSDWNLSVLPFLLLPPGWRFFIAPDYEDV